MKELAFLIVTASWAGGQELTLDQALKTALESSPVLRASRAEVAAARAEIGVARAKEGPQVGATGFLARSNMSMILQGPMGSDPQALVMAPEDEFANLNLMLMMPLFTGGYLSGLSAAASAAWRAAEAEASGMAAEVTFMVRESYARSLYGTSLVGAENARVEASRAMVEVARAQFEAGKGIEAQVQRAEAELAEARQDLAMAEAERKKMILELLATMGAPLEPLPELEGALTFAPVETPLATLLEQAKQTRGELIAARSRLRAAQARAGSARGAQGPQVYGFAMSDTFSPKDEMGRRSGTSFGVVASLPLFDSGMRRSELAAARSMTERARAEVQTWEVRVEKEVRQAWLDLETAAQNIQTARAALEAAQASYDVVRVRVEAGKGILVEQLDALSALTRARTNTARALADHEIAKAKLARAVGLVTQSLGVPTR